MVKVTETPCIMKNPANFDWKQDFLVGFSVVHFAQAGRYFNFRKRKIREEILRLPSSGEWPQNPVAWIYYRGRYIFQNEVWTYNNNLTSKSKPVSLYSGTIGTSPANVWIGTLFVCLSAKICISGSQTMIISSKHKTV